MLLKLNLALVPVHFGLDKLNLLGNAVEVVVDVTSLVHEVFGLELHGILIVGHSSQVQWLDSVGLLRIQGTPRNEPNTVVNSLDAVL